MADILLPDGSIYSSSQLIHSEDLSDQELYSPMVGVILSVNPSDDVDNLAASVKEDQNSWRHECQVLIMDSNYEPNLILENVVIPPSFNSGVDNFSEDLPRGVIRSLDGTKLSEHFKDHDTTRLDAEWCVVQFIGGSIDRPYIANWWHHPLNFHDPATSGQAVKGQSLKQVDPKKNKYRSFRRINGVQTLISPEGDVYLDTTEANSKIEVLPAVKRMGKPKGGSIQIDIKNTQQLEFNWNEPVEGLKAGSTSTSQSREESKPHIGAPKKPVGNPKARETTRTLVRAKEYEMLVKTSQLNFFCEDQEKKGDFLVQAQNSVTIAQQPSGGTTATVNIADGKIQIVGADGSQVSVLTDEIQIVTAGGGLIQVKGPSIVVAANTSVVGSVTITGGPTDSPEPVLLGDKTIGDLDSYLGKIVQAGSIHALASSVSPNPAANAAFITSFVAAATALKDLLDGWKSSNMKTT